MSSDFIFVWKIINQNLDHWIPWICTAVTNGGIWGGSALVTCCILWFCIFWTLLVCRSDQQVYLPWPCHLWRRTGLSSRSPFEAGDPACPSSWVQPWALWTSVTSSGQTLLATELKSRLCLCCSYSWLLCTTSKTRLRYTSSFQSRNKKFFFFSNKAFFKSHFITCCGRVYVPHSILPSLDEYPCLSTFATENALPNPWVYIFMIC